ncbi:MAG: hypothetical protein ABMA64_07695 [Myxococcota bacterium]
MNGRSGSWLWLGLAGCAEQYACVSDTWVRDGQGAAIEACAPVDRRGACEEITGHPSFAGGCGRTFDVPMADCPSLVFTDAGKAQLGWLGVAGESEVGVATCGDGTDTTSTGDTSAR